MRRRNLVNQPQAHVRRRRSMPGNFDKQKHTPTEIGVCFIFLLALGRLAQAALRTFARA